MDRSFASLENLSIEMKNEDTPAVLFFTGPSGTGKTTTLKVLYIHMKQDHENKDLNVPFFYINAEEDEVQISLEGAYVFVDEAQCLVEKMRLR